MSEALKPCPCCGGKLKLYHNGYEAVQIERYIEWLEASCPCGYVFKAFDCTEEKAVEIMNRRAPATLPTVEELRELFWRQEGVHLNLHHAIFLATITLDYLTRRMGGES